MPLKVLIVGAGLGGLAAAIAIARAGHHAVIVERAPKLEEIGAGIQVPPNSTRILQRWGLLPQLEACSIKITDLVFRSYRDGKILSRGNVNPTSERRFGCPYLVIHRADYHRILSAEAERLGVEMKLDTHVVGVDFERPALKVAGNGGVPDLEGDLVIGADGLKSVCREALLGRPDPPRLTGDLVYRVVVDVEEVRRHADLWELVERPASNYWMGPNAHGVTYLIQSSRLLNVVFSAPDTLPEFVDKDSSNLQEIRDIFRDWDPRLHKLFGLAQETTKWRLQDSVDMETSWCHKSGKFALLGDACHATMPYLAQGAAQAVEDGATLGLLLSKLQKSPSPSSSSPTPTLLPELLTLYERLRKPRATSIVRSANIMRDTVWQIPDGPAQRKRDQLLLWGEQQTPEEIARRFPVVYVTPDGGIRDDWVVRRGGGGADGEGGGIQGSSSTTTTTKAATGEVRDHGGPFPNRWKDPGFLGWMFGWDVEREVGRVWDEWERSRGHQVVGSGSSKL